METEREELVINSLKLEQEISDKFNYMINLLEERKLALLLQLNFVTSSLLEIFDNSESKSNNQKQRCSPTLIADIRDCKNNNKCSNNNVNNKNNNNNNNNNNNINNNNNNNDDDDDINNDNNNIDNDNIDNANDTCTPSLQNLNYLLATTNSLPSKSTSYSLLKLNLNESVAIMLQHLGTIQVNLKSGHTFKPYFHNFNAICKTVQICSYNKEIALLNGSTSTVDFFNYHGLLLRSVPIEPELSNWTHIRMGISMDYIILAQKSREELIFFKHDGTKMPTLLYNLKSPISIDTNQQNYVVLVDESESRVVLIKPYENFELAFGSQLDRPGKLNNALDAKFTPDNNIIVLDQSSISLHLYNIKGRYLSNFGSCHLHHEIIHPARLAISEDGCVIILNKRSLKLMVFDHQRLIVYYIPFGSALEVEEYLFPERITLSSLDNIVISYDGKTMLSVLNLSFLYSKFIHPKAIPAKSV